MNVSIRLFAAAAELAEVERITLELPSGTCIGDVRNQLGERFPPLRPLKPRLLFAIGTEYVRDEVLVRPETDEIVCFPPVSGG